MYVDDLNQWERARVIINAHLIDGTHCVMLQLKERGWISAVTAGVTDTDGYDCGTYAAKFDVTMKLTLEGISTGRKSCMQSLSTCTCYG